MPKPSTPPSEQTLFMTTPGAHSPESLTRTAAFAALYHPFEWPETELAQSWMVEIDRDGDIEALVWFTTVYDDIIECHAVAHPDARGRWLKRDVYATISNTIQEVVKPSHVICQIHSNHIAHIWTRLGFQVYPHVAILDLKDLK